MQLFCCYDSGHVRVANAHQYFCDIYFNCSCGSFTPPPSDLIQDLKEYKDGQGKESATKNWC